MYTVVSLMPVEIIEKKPGLHPGMYTIPAAKAGDFEILHVDNASFHIYPDGQPPVKVPELAKTVAESIVNDYRASHIGVLGEDKRPGIFCLEGKLTKEQVSKDYKAELNTARNQQNQWFMNLIKMADNEWSKSRSHRAISELQVIAAKQMNLDREWAKDNLGIEFVKCPYCKSMIENDVLVCRFCSHVVNNEKYNDMKPIRVGTSVPVATK